MLAKILAAGVIVVVTPVVWVFDKIERWQYSRKYADLEED